MGVLINYITKSFFQRVAQVDKFSAVMGAIVLGSLLGGLAIVLLVELGAKIVDKINNKRRHK